MSSPSNSQGAEVHVRWIPVRGDSMWPALRSGDLAGFVLLNRAPKRGDVVIARTRAGLVIHRVLRVRRGLVTLQGDSCRRADRPIRESALIGVVHQVRRGDRILQGAQWDGLLEWLVRPVGFCRVWALQLVKRARLQLAARGRAA
jgi:signal peptidase I